MKRGTVCCGRGRCAGLVTGAATPTYVGFAPTRADVPFVHDRLVKKESNSQVGSVLTFLGFFILVIVIL